MSKVKDLLKQHGLSTTSEYPRDRAAIDVKALEAIYPNVKTYTGWNNALPTSAWIECKKCKERTNHYFDCLGAAGWAYTWPGQSRLISKTLLPLDVLHEVLQAKEDELEAARKKRFEKIQSPRDAVRITFRDLKIEVQMVGGNPRFDCGPCDVEFRASKDDSDPKVGVFFVYHTTNYVHDIALTTLSIADPTFNKKVEAIIFNAKNLNKLMLGEVQPQPVNL